MFLSRKPRHSSWPEERGVILHLLANQEAQVMLMDNLYSPISCNLLVLDKVSLLQHARYHRKLDSKCLSSEPMGDTTDGNCKKTGHLQSTPFWLGLPVILVLGRLTLEDCGLETSLGYTVTYSLKTKQDKQDQQITCSCSLLDALSFPLLASTSLHCSSPFSFSSFKPPDAVLKEVYNHRALCFPP